ncbi:DNA helicase RecQ, partial [Desulfovibrio sp. OttesenSCG-928-I05]|nr:DNA helicase RecQ [Desulfovibrio sp. OttesenSCG-928-I05]
MSMLHARLRSVYGYESFRPYQEEVIRAILAGRDSFTIMPTGGGKSLCYQLPACLMDGVCVVVSPLISLMKDQVDAARANGIAAATLNSSVTASERAAAWQGLRDGTLDLLYVSPERLCMPDFLEQLKRTRVSFFAIDEAHCISSWGHDFRPDYLGLSVLAREFPDAPLAAFTATATARVTEDIVERLGLRDPLRIRASFNRPNLFYDVRPRTDLKKQLLAFLKDREGESGIVYCGTRKDVEKTAALLNAQGITAKPYHAGMADGLRAAVQEEFRRDSCPVIVATIAFGMGIDKPNVRFVVHADLPKNLEGYYQETGRAGRDGDPARCLLLYSRKDIARLLGFVDGMEEGDAKEAAHHQLWQMLNFTQKEGCRRKALLAYFGEDLPGDNCGGCDVCTGEVAREDATVGAQKLLSAMVRTQCRFGARHIISIVLGKETSRILSFGHEQLPTFGVGKDRDSRYWNRVMDAIIARGLATIHDSRFPIPIISDAGWRVLRGQEELHILRDDSAEKITKKTTLRDDTAQGPALLLERLREERTALAAAEGVPAYVIFPDRSLREMSRTMPETDAAMLAVSGVGEHKLAKYGSRFMQIIEDYLVEFPDDAALYRDAVPAADPATDPADPGEGGSRSRKPRRERTPYAKGDTWRETGKLLDQGLNIAEVAELRMLKPVTVITHMEKLAAEGSVFPSEQFIEPARLNYLRKLFYLAGGWALSPVV